MDQSHTYRHNHDKIGWANMHGQSATEQNRRGYCRRITRVASWSGLCCGGAPPACSVLMQWCFGAASVLQSRLSRPARLGDSVGSTCRLVLASRPTRVANSTWHPPSRVANSTWRDHKSTWRDSPTRLDELRLFFCASTRSDRFSDPGSSARLWAQPRAELDAFCGHQELLIAIQTTSLR